MGEYTKAAGFDTLPALNGTVYTQLSISSQEWRSSQSGWTQTRATWTSPTPADHRPGSGANRGNRNLNTTILGEGSDITVLLEAFFIPRR